MDGLGDLVIGRVNNCTKRIWHVVVRLSDGRIYDAVDRAVYSPGIYQKMFEFVPVRSLTPTAVRAFSEPAENRFPNPDTLGWKDNDKADFSLSSANRVRDEREPRSELVAGFCGRPVPRQMHLRCRSPPFKRPKRLA